jgi:hypothetical protein
MFYIKLGDTVTPLMVNGKFNQLFLRDNLSLARLNVKRNLDNLYDLLENDKDDIVKTGIAVSIVDKLQFKVEDVDTNVTKEMYASVIRLAVREMLTLMEIKYKDIEAITDLTLNFARMFYRDILERVDTRMIIRVVNNPIPKINSKNIEKFNKAMDNMYETLTSGFSIN